jgi:hypothetical protein
MAPLRFGVAPHLEAEADRLIKQSLQGVTRWSDKSDILTPMKERMRREREVYNKTGIADPQLRKGSYVRALNVAYPHLNSNDGAVPVRREARRDSLADFVESSRSNAPMDDFWR